MTKLLYFFALAFLFLSACARFAPRTLVFSPTPKDSLLALHPSLGDYKAKYEKYAGVYLLYEQYFDHYGGKHTWYFQRYIKRRYIVLKPHEQWASTFDFTTREHSSISNAFITVASPDGTVHTYNQDDLHSETSSDGETSWKVAYAGIQEGSIVEENFLITTQTRNAPPFDHTAWLQYTLPCDKVKVQYALPDWWDVQLKSTAPDEPPAFTDSLDEDNNKRIFYYTADSVTAYKDEPYAPYYKEVAPYASFVLTHINIESSKYTAPRDWDAFAEEIANYALDNESMWNSDVEDKTEELTAQCSTAVQKLEAIVLYLQQHIKVGKTKGETGFSATLEQKKGSTYMITGLAQTMLDKLDIPSDFLLIHSAADGYFDSTFITSEEMYTPALYTVIGSTPYVVFPYYKNIPIDLIPEVYQGQTALRVNQDGFNGFVTIPAGKETHGTLDERYNLVIDDEGKIMVEEEKTFRGFDAYMVRQRLENLKKEEFDKEIKDMLTYTEGDVHLLSHEVINQDDIRKPLVLKLKYDIDNLVTITPEEVIFQTGGLLAPSSSYAKKVDTTERQNPIIIRNNQTVNRTITLHYPSQWAITTNLQNQEVKNDFGAVSTAYARGTGSLTVQQQWALYKVRANKEHYGKLRTIIGDISTLGVPSIIFSVQ